MSKYTIIIHQIEGLQNPLSGKGTIDGNPFDMKQINYSDSWIWKVDTKNGLGGAITDSGFSRGERSAIARWAKLVTSDFNLIGTPSSIAPSQTRTRTSSSTPSKEKKVQFNVTNETIKDLNERIELKNQKIKSQAKEIRDLKAQLRSLKK